ncbi:unnamed protein product [Bemisia tabaci]|uniref:Uncharacterized protein n=1 Tax=Bemisia tabaci TaxID=7038 RepID=A0A9P0ACT7_BEMTA|nr:unnamed protein product [Bemisia tabaci]
MLPMQPKRPKPTLSIYESTGELSLIRTPVGKAIDIAAMLSDYLDKVGADGKIISNLFLMSWGFDKTICRPIVGASIGGDVNVKRLNPKTAHRIHVISCFKNTTSAVSVDGANLQRWMDKHSSMIDFMSVVTAARAIGLVELACSDNFHRVQRKKINYAMLPDYLIRTNPILFRILDNNLFQLMIEKLAANVTAHTMLN